MKTNQDFKNAALAALKGNWAPAVLTTFIFVAIIMSFSMAINLLPTSALTFLPRPDSPALLLIIIFALMAVLMLPVFFVAFPLIVGYSNATRELVEKGDAKILENTFSTGFKRWWHNTWGMLLMLIFEYLWMLLLIIPGYIKAYSYVLTPYILVEKPELSANQAIDESKRMMAGHKFDMFCLDLSFIGWYLLGILTLGIGYYWILPYHYTARAAFYTSLKETEEAEAVNQA